MYLSLKEIAKRLKLSIRHVTRLARDEDWEYRQGKAGREYNLASVAVHHTEVAKVESNLSVPVNQKSAWEQASEKAQDIARKRLNAVEQVRQHPKHKREIALSAGTSTRSMQRWINQSDQAKKLAYSKRLNPTQTQLEALLPKYNYERKASYAFDDEALRWAARVYATQSRSNLTEVYYHMQNEARIRSWKIGSYSSLERAIAKILSPSTQIAARDGYRKWKAASGYKILRNYDEIWPNFMWVGDHHIFDVFVMYRGKPQRPWITAWTDMKSRSFMGWCISFQPNSRTISLALRHAILPKGHADFPQHGLPLSVYVDNGKDYKCMDLNGQEISFGQLDYPDAIEQFAALGIDPFYIDLEYDKDKRAWVKKRGENNIIIKGMRVGGVFARLGLSTHYATAYHPWAKPIERTFRNVVQDFSRFQPGWCGSKPEERPEKLKWELKSGQILSYEEFCQLWQTYVINEYHQKPHSGHGMNGQCPTDVWAAGCPEPVQIPLPLLDFALLKQTQVTVRNWGFRLLGQDFELILPDGIEGGALLNELIGRRVDVFHDYGLTEARLYYNNRVACEARPLRRSSMLRPDDTVLQEKIKLQAYQEKDMRRRLALIHGGKNLNHISASFYLQAPKDLAQLSADNQQNVAGGVGVTDPVPSLPENRQLPTDNQVVYLSEQERYRALLKAKATGNDLAEADVLWMSEYETSTEYHFSKDLYQTEFEFYKSQSQQ